MTVGDAAQVLESKVFLECLRPLSRVVKMRLPVLRDNGAVEWLEEGYDAPTGIFCVNTLEYDMNWSLGQGQEFLFNALKEYPWNRREGEASLFANRSLAVAIGGLVGTYCRLFFPPGTLMPGLAIFANKPGTGKTRIAEMVMSPVFGEVGAVGLPKDEEKMEVKLETIAQTWQPFAFFDDIGGRLRSNILNRFMTETTHAGRRFHSNSEMFSVPAVTQCIFTANDLKTSEDIGRRALIMELFLDEEVRGRVFEKKITSRWVVSEETRKGFLSALCAHVRHWMAAGMPRHEAPVETFEEWTAVVGGIVRACEWADPLQTPEGDVGGAVDEDEVKRLLIVAAESREETGTFSRDELIKIAQKNGLLEDLVGSCDSNGDPVPVEDSVSKSFGRRMQRWRGQRLKDGKGRAFTFGHKRNRGGAVYPLTFDK
jgi:hypothetical protein